MHAFIYSIQTNRLKAIRYYIYIFKISFKKKLPSIEQEIHRMHEWINVKPLILRVKRLHTDDKAGYDTLIWSMISFCNVITNSSDKI